MTRPRSQSTINREEEEAAREAALEEIRLKKEAAKAAKEAARLQNPELPSAQAPAGTEPAPQAPPHPKAVEQENKRAKTSDSG